MSADTTVATSGPPTGTGSRATLTIASLATLATFLDTTILYVAFPDINATFGSSPPSELSWVLNGFTIVFGALLIPSGKLADRVGHRRVFLAGSAIFTAASMACGLAPTAELLIAFRVAQAAGAAALIPSSLALVMRAFPPERITHAVAIWASAGAFAGALGRSERSEEFDGGGPGVADGGDGGERGRANCDGTDGAEVEPRDA